MDLCIDFSLNVLISNQNHKTHLELFFLYLLNIWLLLLAFFAEPFTLLSPLALLKKSNLRTGPLQGLAVASTGILIVKGKGA